jgi:hypothetical protein
MFGGANSLLDQIAHHCSPGDRLPCLQQVQYDRVQQIGANYESELRFHFCNDLHPALLGKVQLHKGTPAFLRTYQSITELEERGADFGWRCWLA